MSKPSVLIVRGHLVTPWELRMWEPLLDRFDIAYLIGKRNEFDPGELELRPVEIATRRDRAPRGRIGDLVTGVIGDDYVGIDEAVQGFDVVHAAELSFWFSASVARARTRGGDFRLVQTVWETIPFRDAFRNRHARKFRADVLAGTDLYLAATDRARDALRLEGVAADKIEVCPPGINTARFADAVADPPSEHVVLSPGRLVWEKGHQDVMRAVAALPDGLVGEPLTPPRIVIIGQGPEEGRLREYAAELGLAERVEIRSVPYDEMPAVFASASCMVLASMPMSGAAFHPFDIPRVFWEEQFGLVLAEGMASGLDILTTTSGAIPEVVGDSGSYFAPGDWIGLAKLLRDAPLARSPGARVKRPPERVERYSIAAAAKRLGAIYTTLTS